MIYFGSNNTTRKYLAAFIDIFNNITIERLKTDEVSGIIHHKYIRVPTMWATKEKWLQVMSTYSSRKGYDPTELIKRPVEIEWVLPRIGIILTGMSYDTTRHLIKTQRVTDYTDSYDKNIYSPVPYNLEVDVYAIARNLNDVLQIVEQIIPFFTPSKSIDVNIFEDKQPESVPIILSSISPDILDEYTETDDERLFTFTLSFIIKANYYLPKRIDSRITMIEENFIVDPPEIGINQFEMIIQRANLDAKVGTGNDILNQELNPVSTEINTINYRGLWEENPDPPYTIFDSVLYNGRRFTYRVGVDSYVINYDPIGLEENINPEPTVGEGWEEVWET